MLHFRRPGWYSELSLEFFEFSNYTQQDFLYISYLRLLYTGMV